MEKIDFITSVVVTMGILGKVLLQPDCPPCNCTADSSYGGVKAVCSDLQLTSVPQTIPWNTTTLLMDGNRINSRSERAFAALKRLKYLDLSVNWLIYICHHTFTGLTDLEVLLLDRNDLLPGYSSFDPLFVKPLTSLKNISLRGQIRYPYMTYGCTFCPSTLQFLYIDCSCCTFGSSFANLRQLSLLSTFPDTCNIPILDESIFQHTPYLEILDLSNCHIQYVVPGLFDSLRNLRILKMTIQLLFGDEFKIFMEVTKSLQSSPLEYISFSSHRTTQSYPDMFSYLQNTSLRELHIGCGNHPLIRRETFRKLPKSLEVLTLNNIQYDFILTEIKDHPKLKSLDLSNLVILTPYPTDFDIQNLSPILEKYICRNCPFLSNVHASLMKHLKIKEFIIPYNKIGIADVDLFTCLSRVEYFDLSNNLMENIVPLPNNSVTYLNLASNHLGNSITGHNTSTLDSLSKLKTIDLSDNRVSFVSTYAFENLNSVKVINLSNNHLDSINVKLIQLSQLAVLDLHNNKINAIGVTTRKDIEHLYTARLHLEGNPLICGCGELKSLQWMKQNRRRIFNIASLRCRLSTGEYKTLDNLDQIISNLQVQCKSYIVEISVSVCVAICVIALFAGVLLYRHRWKLRYLYYAGRRAYRQQYNREQAHQEQYEYDAFVSYDERDRRFVIDEMMPELEEKHGLKLCIHHRDFLPGEVISDNIVHAIQNSRKTVAILSPSFLQSNWCEFEFNMARMEGVTRRQDIVLMLLYEDVSMMNLSKDMAMMLKNNCYLEYNHEVFNKEIFWFLVHESIQIIRPRD